MNDKPNINQIQQDLDNGIMVSKATIKAALAYASCMEAELTAGEERRAKEVSFQVNSSKLNVLNALYEDLGDSAWERADARWNQGVGAVQDEIYKRIKRLESVRLEAAKMTTWNPGSAKPPESGL